MRDDTPEQHTRNIVKVILYTNAILINSCLLFVLWRDPMKRFRNSPSYIIANLALADIVAAIGGLGATTTTLMCQAGCDSQRNQRLFACMQTTGIQTLFVFITLLAFNRFLAISYPYRYTKIFGEKYYNAFLHFAAWIVCSTLSALVHYINLNNGLILPQLYACDIFVLALITSILYPLNYINYLRKKKLLNAPLHPNQLMEDLRLGQQLNVSWMIAATMLLTLMAPQVCVLVYTLQNCIKCFLDEKFREFWVNYQAAVAVILFINPIIYAWRLPLYRNSSIAVAKIIWRKMTCKKPSGTLKSSNNKSNSKIAMVSSSTTATNDVYV